MSYVLCSSRTISTQCVLCVCVCVQYNFVLVQTFDATRCFFIGGGRNAVPASGLVEARCRCCFASRGPREAVESARLFIYQVFSCTKQVYLYFLLRSTPLHGIFFHLLFVFTYLQYTLLLITTRELRSIGLDWIVT